MTLGAVSDAGPLIHLAEIDSLGLLSVFDTLLIPETVYEEIERGGLPDTLEDISYTCIESDEADVRTEELDAGERAALAAAKEHDVVLLTDDLAARETAENVGIDVHGSIGVIALGYSQGYLSRDEAATRMRALQKETSLFVTAAVVEHGIRLLDNP